MSFADFRCWLLNAGYVGAFAAASPWLAWSAAWKGKRRGGWTEKLSGRLPPRRGAAPCAWFHAASVGEVRLLTQIVQSFQARRPSWDVVLTVGTVTGYEVAQRTFSQHQVRYAPLDFSWAVGEALRRLRPSFLALAELEIWPNLLALTARQGIPALLLNGRLSDRSFRRYRAARPVLQSTFGRLALVTTDGDETARRFAELGVAPAALRAVGSLKYDVAITNRSNPQTAALARAAGLTTDDLLLLAGSTQAPEEDMALATFARLRGEFPRLRLAIAPRHRERFEEAAALIARSGFRWRRRSELALTGEAATGPEAGVRTPWQVLLIDSLGELGAWWGTASAAFVGGSFGARGGQNMLEPAAFGVPVCFGPNTRNFRAIADDLIAAGGARRVASQQELDEFVHWTLAQPEAARQFGQCAQRVVLRNQGAATRTVELLIDFADRLATKSPPEPDASAA